MPLTERDDGLDGPTRSQVWDVALGQLARYERVELQATIDALDETDVTPEQVRRALDEGMVRRGWLKRPEGSAEVWYPDFRAYALLNLTRRGDAESSRGDVQPIDADRVPTPAEVVGSIVA